ncbi:hypothetical protein GNI_104430 [Gregarina niphandrodes]|uniref:Uncharacterized protein n=1 Tax=Gregarina niphandrodes TaxID=110365 RepID=A0A023B465_GRENI|nr:hypothetical protein GNI_104430 [Gregarina niphandrodes]EZG56288.1 hypothetical protein GNI_104430 [Gregarina niphandrodes]|eukprot:XP_011131297.1 hypothetical protein GNI_104430 [Gregarina niphandrodes]
MKTLSCNATSKLERLGLLASLMDSDGMRPPIDGCDVMLLTLGDRRGDAWVQFLAAAPKEAMEKLIEAAMDADALTEEAAALNERKNVHWLEMCSRIFMYSPYGQANTLGEQLAIRCIKEHLDTVDPEGEFSHVSDRIWRESISGKMSELVKKVRYYDDGSLEDLDYQGEDLAMRLLRKPSEIESIEETGSLEVIRCRPLIPEEVADVRGSLPVEWLPLLPETGRDRDVESGLDRGSNGQTNDPRWECDDLRSFVEYFGSDHVDSDYHTISESFQHQVD